MAREIVLHIVGKPRAQPRGRHVGGRVVSTTGKPATWKQLIENEARRASKSFYEGLERMGNWNADDWLTGALCVSVDWYFDTSDGSRWNKPHWQKPDRDNLDKLTLDAMVKGGLFKDDKQVAQGRLAKWWAPRAGVVVVVSPAIDQELWEGGRNNGKDE